MIASRRLVPLSGLRVVAAILLAALPGCQVPGEGEGPVRAIVRYEIEVPDGFSPTEGEEGTLCSTPEFHWIFNKRVDAQGSPTAFDDRGGSLHMSFARLAANGRCVLTTGVAEWVSRGQFRVVATDYDWIATCNVTVIALATSGMFHNVRFVKGADGCQETLEEQPSP
jgi:hypothetical protein